jgi:hypothetical protein
MTYKGLFHCWRRFPRAYWRVSREDKENPLLALAIIATGIFMFPFLYYTDRYGYECAMHYFGQPEDDK